VSADFIVIIPARYASTRLPGKPLLRIGNETLLENVHNSAIRSGAKSVYIATDDERIIDEVRRFGGNTILTVSELTSGTDRVYAAASKLNLPENQIIVNLQGDEYNFNPDHVKQVANALDMQKSSSIATLCQNIISQDIMKNKNVVKVVKDHAGHALYFSRSAIPWSDTLAMKAKQNTPIGYKHIGIYSYRVKFLNLFVNLEPPEIERKESLEQLRAIHHGFRIYVQRVSNGKGIEVNTEDDLKQARTLAGHAH
jgi:3-deoxy-manno-octulosonate cytidylyltransferase (CMP-KDO synthetase)